MSPQRGTHAERLIGRLSARGDRRNSGRDPRRGDPRGPPPTRQAAPAGHPPHRAAPLRPNPFASRKINRPAGGTGGKDSPFFHRPHFTRTAAAASPRAAGTPRWTAP